MLATGWEPNCVELGDTVILNVKTDQMLAASSGSALYSLPNQKNRHFQKGREEGGLGKDERGNQNILYEKKFIVRKLLKGCIYLQDQKRKGIFILKRKWSVNIDHS